MTPVFESERDGVRLYDNRIEVDHRGWVASSTRSKYLVDVQEAVYTGGRDVYVNTRSGGMFVKFHRKETARSFFDALNEAMPGPM